MNQTVTVLIIVIVIILLLGLALILVMKNTEKMVGGAFTGAANENVTQLLKVLKSLKSLDLKNLLQIQNALEIGTLTMCGFRTFIYYFLNSLIIGGLYNPLTYNDLVDFVNSCNYPASKSPLSVPINKHLDYTQNKYLDNVILDEFKSNLIQSTYYLQQLQNIKITPEIIKTIQGIATHIATGAMSMGNPFKAVKMVTNASSSGALGFHTILNLFKINPTDAAFPKYIAKQIAFIIVDYMYAAKRSYIVNLCASLNKYECEALDALLAFNTMEPETLQIGNITINTFKYKTRLRISIILHSLLPLLCANIPSDTVKQIIDILFSGGVAGLKTVAQQTVNNEINNMKQDIQSDPSQVFSIVDRVKSMLTVGIPEQCVEKITNLISLATSEKYIDLKGLSFAYIDGSTMKYYNLNNKRFEIY